MLGLFLFVANNEFVPVAWVNSEDLCFKGDDMLGFGLGC